MSRIRRFDHVGITVADLDAVTAFFVGLGFEVEGRMFMEGEFVDTVIGIPNSRSEIVTLRPPDGGTGLELSSFIRPNQEPGSPDAMPNELGLRNVCFEVDNLQAVVDRLAADGDVICLDAEGAIWCSGVSGGQPQCLRVREGGDVLERIVHDAACFACMLGGADGRMLFLMNAEWRGVEKMGEMFQSKTGKIETVRVAVPHAGRP